MNWCIQMPTIIFLWYFQRHCTAMFSCFRRVSRCNQACVRFFNVVNSFSYSNKDNILNFKNSENDAFPWFLLRWTKGILGVMMKAEGWKESQVTPWGVRGFTCEGDFVCKFLNDCGSCTESLSLLLTSTQLLNPGGASGGQWVGRKRNTRKDWEEGHHVTCPIAGSPTEK